MNNSDVDGKNILLEDCCAKYGVDVNEILSLMKIEDDYAIKTRRIGVVDVIKDNIENFSLNDN